MTAAPANERPMTTRMIGSLRTHTPSRRARLFFAVVVAVLVVSTGGGPATAQRVGNLALWKKRVLDPASVGLETFPGSVFNLKFTIDHIRLDESTAKMAVYLIPVDQMQAAAEFFAQHLGTSVTESGTGTMAELRLVRAKREDARRAGLTVRVEHAQWATGKGQVWLRLDPPAAE